MDLLLRGKLVWLRALVSLEVSLSQEEGAHLGPHEHLALRLTNQVLEETLLYVHNFIYYCD
jgi:hypothetical protein